MHPLNRDFTSIVDFRKRVYMVLGFATLPFLLPFAVISVIHERYVMTLLVVTITFLTLANALRLLLKNKQLIAYEFFYVIIYAAIIWGIVSIGPRIAFWSYPVALMTLFVPERRNSRIMIGISFALLIPCAVMYMEEGYAIRFAVTYAMTCYFGSLVINQMEKLQTELVGLAVTDPLTGAYNRRHMRDCLAQAVEQHQRGLDAGCIITLDIDHFKNINDSLGHNAGDRVLKNFVELLLKRVREADMLFRIGGEEFVILARNISCENALIFAEDLRKHVEQTRLLDDQLLTVSLGVAQYKDGENIDQWLRRADSNLYGAKRQGRNRVLCGYENSLV